MSKQHNIHWRRSDYSRLSHLTRKVNKKIFEIQVTRPDIAEYQPAMLDYKELKNSIKTRRDLKNIINRYERYLREGAEEVIKTDRGGVLTNWTAKEIKIHDLTENARRARTQKKLQEKPVTIAGKETGVKRAEMGSIKENEVKPRTHNIKNMSKSEIENLMRLIDKKLHSAYNTEKQQKMLENYVKGLISEGYSDDLIKLMDKVPIDVFMELVDTDEVATFDFIYDPVELSARSENLYNLWKDNIDETLTNGIDFDAITKEVENEYQQGIRARGVGSIRQPKRKRKR